MVVSSAGTTVFTGINGAAVATGAVGAGAGASVGIGVVGGEGVAANGGAKGAATGVGVDTTGTGEPPGDVGAENNSGCVIQTGAGSEALDGGGGPVGKADGPPDIIFENAIGSIPGGIGIPDISAAAMISAAVGSIVPVM